jgi:hypothetical protein
MVRIMSGDKWRTRIPKLVTSTLVLLTFLIGCEGNEKPGGLVIRETGYLECDLRPDRCTEGQISCTDAEGGVECIDTPTDCSELSCDCLEDLVCAPTATCTITDSADSIACNPDAGTWDPCQGKACGDGCTECDPDDSDCTETDELKSCNAQGDCVGFSDDLCGEYDPCGGKMCGETCSLCDPDDSECIETADEKACNAAGQCTSDTAEPCDAYDPCSGKSCGDLCTLCDPSRSDCPEGQVPSACNESGACVEIIDDLQPICDEYTPCAGKACGDRCTICDPADANCNEDAVIKACDTDGNCVGEQTNMCVEYDPCDGKGCGDICQICAPDDMDCMETDAEETCNVNGRCDAIDDDMCPSGQNIDLVDCSNVDLPADPFTTVSAMLSGTDLIVEVSFSGGCEEHSFAACFGAFQESVPIGVNLNIGHSDPGDPCDGIVSETLIIDLIPMQREHATLYPQGPQEIQIAVTGAAPPLMYRY